MFLHSKSKDTQFHNMLLTISVMAKKINENFVLLTESFKFLGMDTVE